VRLRFLRRRHPAAYGNRHRGQPGVKNLLQKVGFHQEGELRECYWLNGRWHNDWLFGLLRRDYHQPGPSGE
jgi:L-amino acid N-acyltransferase YncA